jgi:hypothetical protein
MSVSYTCVVDDTVLRLFSSAKNREREGLLRIFSALSDNPHQVGDYIQTSAALREHQVKRFGKWLITYWADHGARELRVVDVRRLAP